MPVLNEDTSGPEDWLFERDKELDSLCDKLFYAQKDIDSFIEIHKTQPRLDGSTYYDHVLTVANAAEKMASLFFGDKDLPNEVRYNIRICKCAGLLHEAIPVSGKTYEEISCLSDKSVADCVGALTPYLNEPFSKRLEYLVNKVGLGGPHAQIVKLADLIHDGVMFDHLIDSGETDGLYEAAAEFIVELELFHKSFHHIAKHPMFMPLIAKLPPLLHKLYTYVRKIDAEGSKRTRSKRKNVLEQ